MKNTETNTLSFKPLFRLFALATITHTHRNLVVFFPLSFRTFTHIELLIDGLGRASPIDDAEACIYGYGAVRFLANAVVSANSNGRRSSMPSNASMKKHKTLSCRLIQHGAIPLMILHLQMINEAVKFAISFSCKI